MPPPLGEETRFPFAGEEGGEEGGGGGAGAGVFVECPGIAVATPTRGIPVFSSPLPGVTASMGVVEGCPTESITAAGEDDDEEDGVPSRLLSSPHPIPIPPLDGASGVREGEWNSGGDVRPGDVGVLWWW